MRGPCRKLLLFLGKEESTEGRSLSIPTWWSAVGAVELPGLVFRYVVSERLDAASILS